MIRRAHGLSKELGRTTASLHRYAAPHTVSRCEGSCRQTLACHAAGGNLLIAHDLTTALGHPGPSPDGGDASKSGAEAAEPQAPMFVILFDCSHQPIGRACRGFDSKALTRLNGRRPFVLTVRRNVGKAIPRPPLPGPSMGEPRSSTFEKETTCVDAPHANIQPRPCCRMGAGNAAVLYKMS